MSETINLTPRVTGFRHVQNPVNEAVTVETEAGPRQAVQRREPGINLRYAYTDDQGNLMGDRSANYNTDETTTLLESAGVDSVVTWMAAFDVLKEEFPLLQDAAATPVNTAISGHLRVDVVSGEFRPFKQMNLTLTIGCYEKPDFSGPPIGFYEITCGDKSMRDRRDANLAQINARIDEQKLLSDGEHESQAGLSAEELEKSMKQHKEALQSVRLEKQRIQDAMFTNLKKALQIPEVQTALASVSQAFFAQRIATDPGWSHLDLAAMMQGFGERFAEIVKNG